MKQNNPLNHVSDRNMIIREFSDFVLDSKANNRRSPSLMASLTAVNENDIGIIILGNTGVGKSFLGNLILGENTLKAGSQPDAVTTTTQSYRLRGDESNLLVYDIPGLLEMDQQSIDRNKKEINKAFAQCPESFVLFVWTTTNGRAVHQDMIAFEALAEAFEFPAQCLLHVVNNIPKDRNPDYEAKFIILLSKICQLTGISPQNTLFIETSDPTDEQKMFENRVKLFLSLKNRVRHRQKKEGNIILQLDEIAAKTTQLKVREQEFEKEMQQMEDQMQSVIEEHRVALENAQKNFEIIKPLLNVLTGPVEENSHNGAPQIKLESLYDQHMKERDHLINHYRQTKETMAELCSELSADNGNTDWVVELHEAHHSIQLQQLKLSFMSDIQRILREDWYFQQLLQKLRRLVSNLRAALPANVTFSIQLGSPVST